jgi:hypothetical protein
MCYTSSLKKSQPTMRLGNPVQLETADVGEVQYKRGGLLVCCYCSLCLARILCRVGKLSLKGWRLFLESVCQCGQLLAFHLFVTALLVVLHNVESKLTG